LKIRKSGCLSTYTLAIDFRSFLPFEEGGQARTVNALMAAKGHAQTVTFTRASLAFLFGAGSP
jgi:hypothetical protein